MEKNELAHKIKTQLKNLEEENEVLIQQLFHVQEELEKYFLKNKQLEASLQSNRKDSNLTASKSEQIIFLKADVDRLKQIVDVQNEIYSQIEKGSVNEEFIQSLNSATKSIVGYFSLPIILYKFWKSSKNLSEFKTVGGAGFSNVISAYKDNGYVGVEKFLDGIGASKILMANAYTALARYLMEYDSGQAAHCANFAWMLDPKIYRLKWLMFRLHEAGDLLRADAIRVFVESRSSFSESERNQSRQIEYESNKLRFMNAKNHD